MEDSMKRKGLTIKSRVDEGIVSVSIGREQTDLTASEVTTAIMTLISIRSTMEPSLAKEDDAVGQEGPNLTHQSGLQWRFARQKGLDDLILKLGHPGLGWLACTLNESQRRHFLETYLTYESPPENPKN